MIKMFRGRLVKRGQAIFEYAVILGIVGLALAAMRVYLQRGVQAGIRIFADELGRQEDTVATDLVMDARQGSLAMSSSQVRTSTSADYEVELDEDGQRIITTNEVTRVLPLEDGQPSWSQSWGGWQER